MRLRHELIIARRYEKPETWKGLYVSPAHRLDFSRSLWLVVRTSREATDWLGVELEPDWIVVTPPRSGVFLDLDDETRELFLLHAKLVLRVIPWTKEGNVPDIVLGKRILVKPDDPTRVGVKIHIPEAHLKRPVTGRIVALGPDVEKVDPRIVEGARIMYSLYAGTETMIDNVKHVIMDADQAMMILDDDTKVEAA
jgi:co-chaperonin GroES (HSP10)